MASGALQSGEPGAVATEAENQVLAEQIANKTSIVHSARTGEINAMLAKAGIDPQQLPRDSGHGEQQPLLPKTRTMRMASRRMSRKESSEWAGLTEFEELPWYRRPNVRFC